MIGARARVRRTVELYPRGGTTRPHARVVHRSDVELLVVEIYICVLAVEGARGAAGALHVGPLGR